MGAVLETGDTSTTRTISQCNFMNPSDSIVILFSLRYNTCPSCCPLNTQDKIDFFPPPLSQQWLPIRHLIMNKWKKITFATLNYIVFDLQFLWGPSWSPFDVFCSHSEPQMALSDWQAYQNPSRLYWMSDQWVSKQNAGLLILEKWSNCF